MPPKTALNAHGPPDAVLLRDVQDGDATAAEELFRRYANRVRNLAHAKLSRELARLIDADDIVQSVFRRFFRAAHAGRFAVAPGEDLWELLLVMTLNLLRSEELFHRAQKRDLRRTGELAESAGSYSCGLVPGGDVLLNLAVGEALERLPEPAGQIVRLRLDGYEVAEIAVLTGRSKRSVERALMESRSRLRSLLQLES